MDAQYTMYGWECSHFSGKLRGFLNHKRIPFKEKPCSLYDLQFRVPRNTGVQAMPTVEGPGGHWLVDTPEIMAALEHEFPQRPCRAVTPRQRMMELLLENWFDDSLLAVSLRTRWAHEENWETLLRDQAARDLLPGFPLFLSRRFAETIFKGSMSRALSTVGLRAGGQEQQVEEWALKVFDILEVHFAQHSYLLGEHPTAGDFALLGCLAAHVNRDPWPKREWMSQRPVLAEWSDRLHNGDGLHGDLLADDAIAPTLEPLIAMMVDEFPVLLAETAKAVEERVARERMEPGEKLPRAERDIVGQLAGREFSRKPFPYTLWRMQRAQGVYQEMEASEKSSVDTLFASHGHADLWSRNYGPRLERAGLGTRLTA